VYLFDGGGEALPRRLQKRMVWCITHGRGCKLVAVPPAPSLQACCSSRSQKVQACCTLYRGAARLLQTSRLGTCKLVANFLKQCKLVACFLKTAGRRGTNQSCAEPSSLVGTEVNVAVLATIGFVALVSWTEACSSSLRAIGCFILWQLDGSLFLQLVGHWMFYPLSPIQYLTDF
jgi:hypothetical protein